MFAEGAAFFDRAAAGVPPAVRADRATLGDAAQALANGGAAAGGPAGRGHLAAGAGRARAVPGARADHLVGDLPGVGRPASARCTAAGTSSSRAPRARSTTRRPGSGTSGTFRTAAERLDAVAKMGFDILYVPPVHPIGHVVPQGPEQHPRPEARRPRFAVGDRFRGRRARRDPPRARHLRGLRLLRRPGPRARPRGRDRPGPAGVAGPPVGDRAPEVVLRSAPTARSRTPRTRRRSTRTSTRSTSTTIPKASTPRYCGS